MRSERENDKNETPQIPVACAPLPGKPPVCAASGPLAPELLTLDSLIVEHNDLRITRNARFC